MGREVRFVPKNWKHPKDPTGRYKPLFDEFDKDLKLFEGEVKKNGMRETLEMWGGGPDPDKYMLVDVPPSDRTHLMMYENTSEGTPISPAFENPEDLARWLVDNEASIFGNETADFDEWLTIIKSRRLK